MTQAAEELHWDLTLSPAGQKIIDDAAAELDDLRLENWRLRQDLEDEKLARVKVSNTLWAHIATLYDEMAVLAATDSSDDAEG